MKKFTILSAAAMVAMTANAQNVNPSNDPIVAEKPVTVEWLVLSDGAQKDFEAAGAKMLYLGPDDVNRHLHVWSNGETLAGYDASYPCVDDQEGTYPSFVVTNNDWFGAGYNIGSGDPANLSMFNDDTHFHLAYMTPSGTGPKGMYLTIVGGDSGKEAQVSLGSVVDNHPLVGEGFSDDWQGIDLTFAELKKLCPDFSPAGLDAWTGNIVAFGGAGGNEGSTFSLDAVYFYNLGEAGVEGIAADAVNFVVTGNTINLNGGNGMQLYDMSGKMVKSTNGCVLGINNLSKGVYVVKSGNKTRKVVVK